MNKIDKIKQLANKNDGILFAQDAKVHGISRENLRQATRDGILESVDYGVYVTKDALPDDSFILQKKYKGIIFSHETAGYFLGYTTRDPLVYNVTVLSGYNSKILLRDNIKVYYTKTINQNDIVEATTMFGRSVNCFNIEKTICDLCSPRFKGDKEIALEIVKAYARSEKRDISKLMSYATTNAIKDMLKRYMEVLL